MRNQQPGDSVVDVVARVEACEDPRQGLVVIEETITRLAADGVEIPAEIVQLRRAIETDLVAQSQGR